MQGLRAQRTWGLLIELDATAAAEFAKLPDDNPDKAYYFSQTRDLRESCTHMTIWDLNVARFLASH